MVSLQHTCTSPHQASKPTPMSSPLQGLSVGCLQPPSSPVNLKEDKLDTRQDQIWKRCP